MGYIRHVRAYGIEFKEGPDGIGVYSAKSLPFLKKPRVCSYACSILFLAAMHQVVEFVFDLGHT